MRSVCVARDYSNDSSSILICRCGKKRSAETSIEQISLRSLRVNSHSLRALGFMLDATCLKNISKSQGKENSSRFEPILG